MVGDNPRCLYFARLFRVEDQKKLKAADTTDANGYVLHYRRGVDPAKNLFKTVGGAS